MTYGEVSAARKEIGSGLLFHGLQKVSHFLENLIFHSFSLLLFFKIICC